MALENSEHKQCIISNITTVRCPVTYMYDNIIISEFYLETIVSVSIVGGAAAETD